jgi:hypothetical protein
MDDLHEVDVVARLADKVSWTRAMVRIRRTDSPMATLASGDEAGVLAGATTTRSSAVVLHPMVDRGWWRP